MSALQVSLVVLALSELGACALIAGVDDGKLASKGGSGGMSGAGTGGTSSGGKGGTASGGTSSGGTSSGGTSSGGTSSGGTSSGGTNAGGTSGAAGTSGSGGSGTGGSTGSKYADAVLTDAPLGYWRLGDALGSTVAVDSSGHGNDCTANGSVQFGEAGALTSDTAAYFDGTSYLDCGDKFGFAGKAVFSVEAWIYPQTSSRGFLGKTFYDTQTRGWMVAEGVNNDLQFIRESADTVAPALAETKYTQLVLVYDGLNQSVWQDGAQVQTAPFGNQVSTITYPFTIGTAKDWKTMLGWIDEVSVYDKVLDSAQIKAHFDAATTP